MARNQDAKIIDIVSNETMPSETALPAQRIDPGMSALLTRERQSEAFRQVLECHAQIKVLEDRIREARMAEAKSHGKKGAETARTLVHRMEGMRDQCQVTRDEILDRWLEELHQE